MNLNYVFPTVNDALIGLSGDVLALGEEMSSRGGVVKELTSVSITLERPLQREILLSHRKASLAAQVAETMWVLAGRDDVEWLAHYLPRAAEFSDDGSTWRGAYGPRIRSWGGEVDQLDYVVDLLWQDRSTRRAVINIYDPVIDSAPGLDIPCNNHLHFLSRFGELDLHVVARSNDLVWGWSGINQFEWSVLLEIVAGMVGMEPGKIHYNISSLHIYGRHWEKARKISELTEPVVFKPDPEESTFTSVPRMDEALREWFHLESRIRSGEKVRVEDYSGPTLFKDFLSVIQWWWTGEEDGLPPRYLLASKYSVQPPQEPKETKKTTPEPSTFIDYVTNLHSQKHQAYGDSWKRRGEMLGILANIARKVDRLGVTDEHETAADTAIDLAVYLAKYWSWLVGKELSDTPEHANNILRSAYRATLKSPKAPVEDLEKYLISAFDNLEGLVARDRALLLDQVDKMLQAAVSLARRLWWRENNAARSWKGYE